MPEIEVTYFDFEARGEKLRLALDLAGLPFKDNRIDFKTMAGMAKDGTLPYGTVPFCKVDGKVIGQSGAMLRWIGRQGDGSLFPQDIESMTKIEEVLNICIDYERESMVNFYMGAQSAKYGLKDMEKDMRKKTIAAATAEWTGVVQPKYIGWMERFLTQNGGPFLAGPKVTIADCFALPQMKPNKAAIDKGFPKLAEWLNRMMDLPTVKARYANSKL